MFNTLESISIEQKAGLYFHIPFCIQKCNYCDFYSITNTNNIDKFVDYLIKELDLFQENHNEKNKVDTLFFGGGTPSLLKPQHFERIFKKIYSIFNVDDSSEITIEANPGTIDIKNLKEIKSLGVNRISFGVQSFNENELKFLNRIHTADEAIKSIKYAKEIGYENISADLIFGIPGQSTTSWMENLRIISELNIEHLSVYNLIYEENTPLFKQLNEGKFAQLDEQIEEEIYYQTVDFLELLGFLQYEVSNFSKSGFECKHNIKYWTHFPYFGFGPSSHSYYNRQRYWNYRNLKKYYEKIDNNHLPVEGSEIIDNNKFIIERIMLGLRYQGLDLAFISDIIDLDINKFIEQNIIPIQKSFLTIFDKIILSKYGFFKLNEIALKLINQIDLKKI